MYIKMFRFYKSLHQNLNLKNILKTKLIELRNVFTFTVYRLPLSHLSIIFFHHIHEPPRLSFDFLSAHLSLASVCDLTLSSCSLPVKA